MENFDPKLEPATYNLFLEDNVCVYEKYHKTCQKHNIENCPTVAQQHINELVADIEGMEAAYNAFKMHEKSFTIKENVLPQFLNYTNDQVFFLTASKVQCRRNSTEKDPTVNTHPPSTVRIDLVVENFDEFTNTFNCHPESDAVKGKNCHLWYKYDLKRKF